MPARLNHNQPRRVPSLSISLEESIAELFKNACAANDTTVSREVRQFILKYLKNAEAKNVK